MSEINIAEKRFEKTIKCIAYPSLIYAVICLSLPFFIDNNFEQSLRLKAFGFIAAYYIPIITKIFFFLTSKQNVSISYAPNGNYRAKTRDCVTIFIFHAVFILPIILYSITDDKFPLEWVNNSIIAAQAIVQTVLAPGFSFYFGTDNTKSS